MLRPYLKFRLWAVATTMHIYTKMSTLLNEIKLTLMYLLSILLCRNSTYCQTCKCDTRSGSCCISLRHANTLQCQRHKKISQPLEAKKLSEAIIVELASLPKSLAEILNLIRGPLLALCMSCDNFQEAKIVRIEIHIGC